MNITITAHSLKALYPGPSQRFFEEIGKIHKIENEKSVIKCVFNKIVDM